MTQHTQKAVKFSSSPTSLKKSPKIYATLGNGSWWQNPFQEKEVGEPAPTGQRRKSVVLLVTLDGRSHALTHRQI